MLPDSIHSVSLAELNQGCSWIPHCDVFGLWSIISFTKYILHVSSVNVMLVSFALSALGWQDPQSDSPRSENISLLCYDDQEGETFLRTSLFFFIRTDMISRNSPGNKNKNRGLRSQRTNLGVLSPGAKTSARAKRTLWNAPSPPSTRRLRSCSSIIFLFLPSSR